jgi:hypothetical protein
MTPEERIKELSDFKKSLTEMTEEQLRELAAKLVEESKELDGRVSQTEYTLPTKGQKDAFEAIKYFLNTQKVKWNYALGIITIYEYFDQAQKTITFAMLDTVLRLLGSLEFTGYDEWKKVSLVNDYFTPVAQDYRDLTDEIYNIGERYAAVDGQLKMFAPVDPEEVPTVE